MVHILILLVSIFDQFIKIHEVLTCILIVEVTSERNVNVLSPEVISNIGHLSREVEQALWQVVSLESLVINDHWLCSSVVKVETLKTPVHVIRDMCEDVICISSVVRE